MMGPVTMPNLGYELLPHKVEGVEYPPNWHWTCAIPGNHATDKIWERLDPELWTLMRNPWLVLQTVSHQA
jgi:glycogen phosphorylase